MAGGYRHTPDGVDGVGAVVKGLQRQIDAIRSGAGIKSAILRDNDLTFQNEDGQLVARFGKIRLTVFEDGEPVGTEEFSGSSYFDPTTGRLTFLTAAYENGDTTVQSGSAADISALDTFRAYANYITLHAGAQTYIEGDDDLYLKSNHVWIEGESGGIDILSGGHLRIYELPTTGSSANLRLNTSTVEIQLVTSSRKYKEDIADAEVDLEDVLALRGRSWVDKGSIDQQEEPGDIRRDVGFIAEELDELPSMRQFVDYDEDGEPDAIQYDRLTVALLALAQAQQERLDNLEERLTRLEEGSAQ